MAIGKDIKDLYDILVKQELTDKSFDEFKSAVEDEQYRNLVYEVLIDRNLYKGEKTQFDDNYFFEFTPAGIQKKKKRFRWNFSRGKYGIHFRSSRSEWFIGVFNNSK